MKQIAQWAIDTANQRGASYADARLVDERQRALSTKNGKVGHVSESESLGIGVRVIADGAWGFAASDRLDRASVDAAAAQAVAIAKASAQVKFRELRLAPEKPAVADWTSPHQIDPFSTSVDRNMDLLLQIDRELLSTKRVTLAETSLN